VVGLTSTDHLSLFFLAPSPRDQLESIKSQSPKQEFVLLASFLADSWSFKWRTCTPPAQGGPSVTLAQAGDPPSPSFNLPPGRLNTKVSFLAPPRGSPLAVVLDHATAYALTGGPPFQTSNMISLGPHICPLPRQAP